MSREAIESAIINGDLNLFSEIPASSQDKELACLWVSQGKGGLRDIPPALIDDDVRFAAMAPIAGNKLGNASYVADSLRLILPEHTDRYEDIALAGVNYEGKAIWSVDFSYLTTSFLMKALAMNNRALFYLVGIPQRFKRSKIVIDQEVIDFAVSNSPVYFGFFANHQYSTSALRQCIKNHQFDYKNLIKIGRLDVLTELVREGFWCHDRDKAPEDLDAGIKGVLGGSVIHMAYVKQFPIREVIEHMDTLNRKIALFNLYPTDELARNIKNTHLAKDTLFKSLVLECEMGL
jgi:hypothetical protein